MVECAIQIRPNGPYRLSGPARIIDPQGNVRAAALPNAVSA